MMKTHLKDMATAQFKDAKGVPYLLSCRLGDSVDMLAKACEKFYETAGVVLVKVTPLFPEMQK